MQKLWEKKYTQNKTVEAYCFGDTTKLDNKLIFYDVLGSIAHTQMLKKIGILTGKEGTDLTNTLIKLTELIKAGKFHVELGDEDVHTKIENYVVTKLGNLGKKIHTARSRNDQVLVDLKLFTKDNIFNISHLGYQLVDLFLDFALKYEFTPMPGYTHMQRAMPSSIGMWSASFAESLLDDLEILKCSFVVNDQSPLGTGAAYGVSLPIDRHYTTKILGFSKVQNNCLYAQSSRGKSHLVVLHALVQIMLSLSRFAQDLLLFTTTEFNFFSVNESLCTGSSIMPQKNNLDVMEYLRGKTHVVFSLEQSISAIISSLPSGYNADFGETKYPFMKAIEITTETLKVCNVVIQEIKPNEKNLKQACSSELYATHAAYQLVKEGVPFRDAYKKVRLSLNTLPTFEPIAVLKDTNHVGGPGNLGLKQTKNKSKKSYEWWKKQHQYYVKKINKLIKLGANI